MLALLSPVRKAARLVVCLAIFGALAACDVPISSGPSLNTRGAVKVALLVPASNPDAGGLISQSLENAARLAINDLQGADIDLQVYDTGGDPQIAATVAQQAASDGAKIILGPLFAEAAASAGVAVRGRNINVLAFSNNPAVAGGNVFILGNTFQSTANRLVRYANAQGRGTIFIVHGQNTEEELGRNAIQGAISASGAQLAGVESFELSQQGVINAIPQISDRIDLSGATSVFLTSGTDGALSLLAGLLPENGIDPTEVQTIGLKRFDVPSSAGLAYDGIAAIGALIASGEAGGLSAQALTRPGGFAGANGVFRLTANGTNERALAVAQVENNQVIVIDPAPRSFGGAGF